MTDIRPRKITHRGRVDAAGFLFDTDLIGVAETRRRILDLWEPGVQVFKDGPNYFVRLSSNIKVDCASSIATPLVQIENVLSALPLSPDELELLQPPPHSVVFSKGGVVDLSLLIATKTELPERWLDVTGFNLVEVRSLGAAFTEPTLVSETQPFDARTKLDGVPAEASGLRETLAAIKLAGSGGGNRRGDWGTGLGLRAWFGDLIGTASAAVGNRFRLRSASTSDLRSHLQKTPAKENDWLTRLGLRLLHTSRLSRVLGRRQAEYVGKMMDMFERGDINEALRHAIPLGEFSELTRPSFGVPSPRNDLLIRPGQAGSGRSISLGIDLMSYLNQLYRSSFERLVAQNRIEEAAFVLAELLRANEEAVAFLERHGKFTLAAELAEARKLAPGLVVRQWFIAGEIKRAIGIARRTEAFADAVVRLENQNKEQAQKLRVLWAESWAEGGNYAGAVNVIWPIESERLRAREWMDRAIAVGGPVAGRMLARKLATVPEEFDDIRCLALTFLEDESFEHQETRTSFAEALCAGSNTKETQTLARATARAILRDASQNPSSVTAKQFTRFVNFTADGALRTDVPAFPSHDETVNPLLSIECAAADCGSMEIRDAVLLPNGRILVALGEIGVRLLTRDGRTVTHFDYPAERLVISDNSARAIALARRGEVWRLSRLDLIDWRGEDWCDARIDAFAPNYDGSLWYLGAKGDFYAIDTHVKSFEAFWRVPDADSEVLNVARSESSCSFLTVSHETSELRQWVYILPVLTLRNRTSVPVQPENGICMNRKTAFSPEGIYADQSLYGEAGSTASGELNLKVFPNLSLRVFAREEKKLELAIGDDLCVPLAPEIFGTKIVSPVLAKDGVAVRLFDLQSKDGAAQLILRGANQVSTRLTENTLTVGDNLGRVIVVDLRRNCSIRNLRI